VLVCAAAAIKTAAATATSAEALTRRASKTPGGKQIAVRARKPAVAISVLTYRGKSATTRSTGAGEILPILYELAGVMSPAPGSAGPDEPGYPLVADASGAAIWFYGALPLMFVGMWWLASASRRIARRRSR